MIPGRLVHADAQEIWLARGSGLAVSRDQGQSWQPGGRIPAGLVGQLAASTPLGRRLARAGIHHFIPGNPDVACMNDSIFQRMTGDKKFTRVSTVAGSRPLALANDGELVCYGEYRSNAKRDSVHVWGASHGSATWHPLYRFRGVRHIHGVFFDPYDKKFWITTGDDDDEAGIWVSEDRFSTVEKVAGGSQQLRAVQLLFTEKHIYYGSDTPVAKNFIYRMERNSGRIECLQAVGSSVFFGCKVGDVLFLSTAAEPSEINRTDAVELWCSLDGERWSLLRTFAKDRWSLRYFQYGQVLFPAGPGDGENLYFTPFATEADQCTFKLPLSEIKRTSTDLGTGSGISERK